MSKREEKARQDLNDRLREIVREYESDHDYEKAHSEADKALLSYIDDEGVTRLYNRIPHHCA